MRQCFLRSGHTATRASPRSVAEPTMCDSATPGRGGAVRSGAGGSSRAESRRGRRAGAEHEPVDAHRDGDVARAATDRDDRHQAPHAERVCGMPARAFVAGVDE
mmetsp:Transcript_44860/g.138387  ORF Transcript_44860/g.138387 Transcript_44860/m.138387 type:complete len:104 (-) Transcript_44860:44-355(-)